MINVAQVKALRRTNYVGRLAGIAMNTSYSVAEHHAQAAALYVSYCQHTGEELDGTLLAFIVCHDALEVFTGDLLAPAKNLAPSAWDHIEHLVLQHVWDEHNVDLTPFSDSWIEANPYKKRLWKLCDLTELYCKVIDEYNLGNRSEELKAIIVRVIAWIENLKSEYFSALIHDYDVEAYVSAKTGIWK